MSKSDNVTNLVVIALGIFVVYHSYYSLRIGILISPGAGFLPFLCGLALVALGFVWRLQTILFKSPPQVENAGDPLAAVCEAEPARLPGSRVKLCLAFAATLAYACLFERIGFLAATLVFMLGWQVVVERQRWLKAIIITALCTAAMYTLFRYLLHVELPSNPLLS
ncbi:MAG: tripartite tricarboxylate transporter TctB family protein [Deltaproteobacteria bacterium]|nr:tripartite tricarboxylate transporter TctB family protein [Deltaproteobacteria bacterium]